MNCSPAWWRPVWCPSQVRHLAEQSDHSWTRQTFSVSLTPTTNPAKKAKKSNSTKGFYGDFDLINLTCPADCVEWWSCSWVCWCWGWSGPSGWSTSRQQDRRETAPSCDSLLTDRRPLQSNHCFPFRQSHYIVIRCLHQDPKCQTILLFKILDFPGKFRDILLIERGNP